MRGGEALPLRLGREPSSIGGIELCCLFICCIAAWAAIREADTVGAWSEEVVGKDGSKKPCE